MEVEIPISNERRKIKNIQCWKEDVTVANMGERAALLFHAIPNLEKIDRTIIFEPGALSRTRFVYASAHKITFFKPKLINRCKLLISVGFNAMLAECQFFVEADSVDEFELKSDDDEDFSSVLLSFDSPIYTKPDSLYIASKLDSQDSGCRFAFHGKIQRILNDDRELCRFRRKIKFGQVERIENETSLICKNMFKKESNIDRFIGMPVKLSTGEKGFIESTFGKSGKVRIRIDSSFAIRQSSLNEEIFIYLYLKKYLNDHSLRAYIP